MRDDRGPFFYLWLVLGKKFCLRGFGKEKRKGMHMLYNGGPKGGNLTRLSDVEDDEDRVM